MRRPRRAFVCAVLALLLATSAAAAAPYGLEGAPDSFRSWIASLPEDQQRIALRRLGDMPSQRRQRLFMRWESLAEGERRVFEQRMLERLEQGVRVQQRLQAMSPESRAQLVPLMRRWREMGPLERRRMRLRLERFRALSPEAQQALIEKRFAAKSPEQRERILEALREASKALGPRPLLDAEPTPLEPAPAPGRD